ncbi:MAG TPA: hypothetical protein VFZ09_30225 [Archangium sp.]|uniref:hypothetical protein n=1 Tax=Archangium sp. TaxID=1872627 RepID=UPI002E370DA1|nr:hypothetical protein [Archangium sp.]HEX5750544.1 hypothetical protein [Archangium sp.]
MSSSTSPRPALAASVASPGDVRVQLEGAWEVLEQAHAQETALLKALASFRWRKHLQRDPELPRRVRELEAPLAQALERVEHRLSQESWPGSHPLHRLTRQLRGLRASLERRVRQRLAFWEPEGEWSFAEGLARLEVRARDSHLQVPGEPEPVLLTGGVDSTWGSAIALFLLQCWGFPAARLGLDRIETLVSGVLMIAGIPLLVGLLRRRARFWLTPRRLVWRTSRGQVKELPLDSLRYATTHPFFARNGLVVRREDGPRSLLAGMDKLQALMAVLALRELPVLGLREKALSAPTSPLAMFPAVRGEKTGSRRNLRSGVLVMRPGQLVFLEDSHLWNIVRRLVRETPGHFYGLTLLMLLEQLQLLPEAEFDRHLEQLTPTGSGYRWSFSEVTHGLTADDKYKVHLPDGTELTGVPDATQQAALSRVLQLGRSRT